MTKDFLYYSAAAVLGLCLLSGCDDDKTLTLEGREGVLISSITFDLEESYPLALGVDYQLTTTVLPDTATYPEITYSSSAPEVATVDASGRIHAVALGQATISAVPAIGFGPEAAVTIQVIPEVINAQTITVTNTTPASEDGVIYVTDRLQLAATIAPANHTYSKLAWSSSNESIATVDAAGLVQCVGAGSVEISAAATQDASGVVGKLALNVREYIAVEQVKIAALKENLCITGKPVTLDVTYSPANATLGSVEWSSSDEGIVSVDRGVVTPHGFGTALVMAKCLGNGETASVSVTVEPGLWIWDATNQWQGWVCSNTAAEDNRGSEAWRVNFPDAGTGNWRRDIKVVCDKDKPFVMSLANYPVLAMRCTRPDGGNSTLDAVELTRGGAGNPNPHAGTLLDDGSRLLIFDLTGKYDGADLVYFNIFQFKIADIPNDKVDKNSPYYNVYWIRTFHTATEAEEYAKTH